MFCSSPSLEGLTYLFFVADHGTCPRSFADRVSVFVFMTLQKRTAKRDSFPPYVCTDLPFGTSVAIRNPQSFITNWLQNLFPCGFEFRVHRITGWLYSVLYRLKNNLSISCPNSESFQMNSTDLPRLKWTCPFHVGRVVRLLLDLKQCETRGQLNDWSRCDLTMIPQLGVVYHFPGWNMYPNKKHKGHWDTVNFPGSRWWHVFPCKSWDICSTQIALIWFLESTGPWSSWLRKWPLDLLAVIWLYQNQRRVLAMMASVVSQWMVSKCFQGGFQVVKLKRITSGGYML